MIYSTNKYMKGSSISILIREMQSKTPMKHHFTHIKMMAIIEKVK